MPRGGRGGVTYGGGLDSYLLDLLDLRVGGHRHVPGRLALPRLHAQPEHGLLEGVERGLHLFSTRVGREGEREDSDEGAHRSGLASSNTAQSVLDLASFRGAFCMPEALPGMATVGSSALGSRPQPSAPRVWGRHQALGSIFGWTASPWR